METICSSKTLVSTYNSGLRMEAVCSSETLVSNYKSTYNPEEHQHLHRNENPKFHNLCYLNGTYPDRPPDYRLRYFTSLDKVSSSSRTIFLFLDRFCDTFAVFALSSMNAHDINKLHRTLNNIDHLHL
jgi:hypothetical protein